MRLPDEAIHSLCLLIKGEALPGGDVAISPRYTIAWIGEFFERFGGDGLYPPERSPDAQEFVWVFLSSINGTVALDKLIEALPDFCADEDEGGCTPVAIAYAINKVISPFGAKLSKTPDVFSGFAKVEFALRSSRNDQIEVVSLVELNDQAIMEHVGKASEKILGGDFAGAISSSYTLVEGFLKVTLQRLEIPYNENEGDIRVLYKACAVPLGLNPEQTQLENYLKPILGGLKGQIGGLYELANKASDRHARIYDPARHHAKLAVNAAFTLCEFLLDSYEYEKTRPSPTDAA